MASAAFSGADKPIAMTRRPRILAIASGGGHWVQLLRLRPALADYDVAFVSMFDSYREVVAGHRYYTIPDASRFSPASFLRVLARAIPILIKERPRAIVTTGSAPALVLVLLGRMMGARTLWIDSIANAEHMSSSGKIARRVAHEVVSQWPDVAEREGVGYWGAVL